MSSEKKERRVIIGRRSFIENSEAHNRFLEQTDKSKPKERVKQIEPEKENRSGPGQDTGKPK